MTAFSRVLITGTTSGLGRSMMEAFLAKGAEVICINQRRDAEFEAKFPRAQFHMIDITSYDAVCDFLRGLEKVGNSPDLFVLSAGINKIDNANRFQFPVYQKVMQTNLTGVMTFVGAIAELNLQGRTILGMSSTSNIVPNPGHIGYYLSKLAIKEAFILFAKNDPANNYQTVVLGPVYTRIMRDYPNPTGFQGKIFNFLAVPSDVAVSSIVAFAERRVNGALMYPLGACLFYYFVRAVLFFAPGIYRGSRAT